MLDIHSAQVLISSQDTIMPYLHKLTQTLQIHTVISNSFGKMRITLGLEDCLAFKISTLFYGICMFKLTKAGITDLI